MAGLFAGAGTAAITAGAGLLQGLFGASAAKARERRERQQRIIERAFETQRLAQQQLTQGQQQAFQNIVGGLRESLLRRG